MIIAEELEKRMEAIAENYRAAGYDVLRSPSDRDLPSFVQGYRPDILARKPGDNVLIEVKHSASRPEMDRFRDIAERIHAHPGWRLDVFFSGLDNGVGDAPDYPLLSSGSTRMRLDDAERLLDSGYPEAALLLAWAATEGYLRGVAAEEDVLLPRQDTGNLLTQLATSGAVSRTHYHLLRGAMSQRNAVAHGFAATGVQETARDVIRLGREFLAETGRAA